ncbi:MAG: hypothetical protein HY983_03465 [Candidatus Magasanikbacteria bacterium]|nr:hypothetical protein [Candidatus Magasanikbacteria bacterium]
MTYTARNIPEGTAATKPERIEHPSLSATSFFDQLSSKSALIVGLVGGVMTLCTIGFVILLTIFLKAR